MQVGIALVFDGKGDICCTTRFFLYLLLLVKFRTFLSPIYFMFIISKKYISICIQHMKRNEN